MLRQKPFRIFLIISTLSLSNLACSKSDSPDPYTNTCSGTPGPLFTAVKDLIQTNCISCHTAGGQASQAQFTNNCTIVSMASNIRTRAVVEGTMPPTGPLSQADKNKITAWVNAGGRLTD